jgi:hypothetical protein
LGFLRRGRCQCCAAGKHATTRGAPVLVARTTSSG